MGEGHTREKTEVYRQDFAEVARGLPLGHMAPACSRRSRYRTHSDARLRHGTGRCGRIDGRTSDPSCPSKGARKACPLGAYKEIESPRFEPTSKRKSMPAHGHLAGRSLGADRVR